MGDLPQIGPGERRPRTITVPRHWTDHHFQGRAVLPAVEAMQLLAHWVGGRQPSVDSGTIVSARFTKFLPLAAAGETMTVALEITDPGMAGAQAALTTRVSARTARMSRTVVHVQAVFGQTAERVAYTPQPPAADPDPPDVEVPPHRIYAELVPFGPAYRNISHPLHLWPHGALARVQAPRITDPQTDQPLGSPFVLDAAFHAACVWSQRYAGVVAFPVGLDQRRVHQKTMPGGNYLANIVAVQKAPKQLSFDIHIADSSGDVCETVHGVQMRDVSGGRMKPPNWIAR
ncbi:MAG: hypothetical protein HKP58_10795 [Desulfatitalea sp.]|nr:polyketide synthase dehydratase domain-containing protein [Desulfatitalea sp.]NNK00887.1 hypothetical protein [Desulfatitalea sp.]